MRPQRSPMLVLRWPPADGSPANSSDRQVTHNVDAVKTVSCHVRSSPGTGHTRRLCFRPVAASGWTLALLQMVEREAADWTTECRWLLPPRTTVVLASSWRLTTGPPFAIDGTSSAVSTTTSTEWTRPWARWCFPSVWNWSHANNTFESCSELGGALSTSWYPPRLWPIGPAPFAWPGCCVRRSARSSASSPWHSLGAASYCSNLTNT
jgi:hypothetical protein